MWGLNKIASEKCLAWSLEESFKFLSLKSEDSKDGHAEEWDYKISKFNIYSKISENNDH